MNLTDAADALDTWEHEELGFVLDSWEDSTDTATVRRMVQALTSAADHLHHVDEDENTDLLPAARAWLDASEEQHWAQAVRRVRIWEKHRGKALGPDG